MSNKQLMIKSLKLASIMWGCMGVSALAMYVGTELGSVLLAVPAMFLLVILITPGVIGVTALGGNWQLDHFALVAQNVVFYFLLALFVAFVYTKIRGRVWGYSVIDQTPTACEDEDSHTDER